jgi:hypothetical protein
MKNGPPVSILGFPCCYWKRKDGIDKEQLLVDAHVAGALVF